MEITQEQRDAELQDRLVAAKERDLVAASQKLYSSIDQEENAKFSQNLLQDRAFIDSAKILFQSTNGTPFEGDDAAAVQSGIDYVETFSKLNRSTATEKTREDVQPVLDVVFRDLDSQHPATRIASSYLLHTANAGDPIKKGEARVNALANGGGGWEKEETGWFQSLVDHAAENFQSLMSGDAQVPYMPLATPGAMAGGYLKDAVVGVVKGIPDGAQGILDLGHDIDNVFPMGKIVWGRGNGLEWIASDDPGYTDMPTVQLPQFAHGDSGVEEAARVLGHFFTVFAAGGGLAGTMARGVAAGALADATFDPEMGNLSTMLEEMGIKGEVIELLNSQVGEDATAEERLRARGKNAIEGALLSVVIEPLIMGIKAAKSMGAGPALEALLNNAGEKWKALLPPPGQLNMGVGTTRGATGGRVGTTGQYVGAPGGVTTPQGLSALTRRVTAIARHGEVGRYWYEKSGESILRAVNGDKAEAEKIAQLIGIFSSNTPVENNMHFALQTYFQHKAGMPIKSGMFPTAMSKKAKNVLDGGSWEGRKTNNFYTNLMRVIDPEKNQGVTVDVWMMRAFGYEKDTPTPAQYDFVEKKVKEITDRFNQNLGPDEAPWEPQQVQAAIWVAEKAGHPVKGHPEGIGLDAAKFDYADAMNAMNVQVSWESIPGRTSSHLPEMFDAPYPQQAEYHVAISKAFLDDDGGDIIAKRLGILSPGDFEAPGYFEGKLSPGTQTEIIAPRQYKGPKYGKVDASIEDLINRYAAIRGILMKQDMVAWHRPFWNAIKRDQDGAQISLGRPFTDDETAQLAELIAAKVGHGEFNPISTRDGVRILNLDYMKPAQNPDGLSNVEFQKALKEVMDAVEWDVDYTIDRFATQSNAIDNNWKEALNGEGYFENGSQGQPDILRQLHDIVEEIQPRIDDVDRDFSERYGWTINEQINSQHGGQF